MKNSMTIQPKELDRDTFILNIPNIDRACSTVIENSVAIFLPHKRLDITEIEKEFIQNNRVLEIETDLFQKVEIRARLLGQIHKDILEVLLNSPKIYSNTTNSFKVKTTSYRIFKGLKKKSRNKKWLIEKLDDIADCRIKLFFKDDEGNNISFNFGFISSILGKEDKELIINFTPEYTHFMAVNELMDYSNYIDSIVQIDSPFIKAVVRYMLIHRGKNSQIRIDNLIEKLNLDRVISSRQLEDDLVDLKRETTQRFLQEHFGITLTNDKKTLTFNKHDDKKHYFIKNKVEDK